MTDVWLVTSEELGSSTSSALSNPRFSREHEFVAWDSALAHMRE